MVKLSELGLKVENMLWYNLFCYLCNLLRDMLQIKQSIGIEDYIFQCPQSSSKKKKFYQHNYARNNSFGIPCMLHFFTVWYTFKAFFMMYVLMIAPLQ